MMRALSADRPHYRALPLLLVDIDGVVSLWGWPPAERPDGAWTLVDGVAHVLSAPAAARLASLADDFELVWASGWEEKANEHLPRLVGLGPFPHLAFEPTATPPASFDHWKLAAIDAFAGADRPLAWIDDDLTLACHAWAAARPGPTLLIPTVPAAGVTDNDVSTLRAWAGELLGRYG